MATKTKSVPVEERTFTAAEVAHMLEAHFAVAHVRAGTPHENSLRYAVAHVTLENGQQYYVTVEPGDKHATYGSNGGGL